MKSKGGRGKPASYTTVTIRIPEPIQAEVERLKAEFYATYTEPVPIQDFTGLSKTSPIEELGFPRELYNKLKRNQINTLGDLLKLHDSSELKSIKNVGRVSLKQIEEVLALCVLKP